jgi:WD40 repeat protein
VCTVQSKGLRRGRKLVACLPDENRVVIHNLETSEQKIVDVLEPYRCVTSHEFLVLASSRLGLSIFSLDGVLVQSCPAPSLVVCLALYSTRQIVVCGSQDGYIFVWDILSRRFVSFKEHSGRINNLRFAIDGRLFSTSVDATASIVTLDDHHQISARITLHGHALRVNDILPLPLPSLSQCVTCSDDKTIKVWDCETGACLRTLARHTSYVTRLALHPSRPVFASGSWDQSVIIWAADTFEALRHFEFVNWVQSLVLDDDDMLYVGVYLQGVISLNAVSESVGSVLLHGRGALSDLAIGKLNTHHFQYSSLFGSNLHSTFIRALDSFDA